MIDEGPYIDQRRPDPLKEGGLHAGALQAWWSELITEGVAPPGRFAHAAAGAGNTMYMVGGYAQGQLHSQCGCALQYTVY